MNCTLNIPEGRMFAANWVYQISVLSACVGILGVPFESAIIAKEKLSIYAYISIVEAILKLLLVFLLFHSPIDILIYYAILIFAVNTIVLVWKLLYCFKKIDFSRPKILFSKKETKEIGKFTSWSLFGQIAYIGSTTGLNMVINVFLGVTINAAVGIANQVNTIVYNFVGNFQTSFNPQLIQTYSSNNLPEHRILISRASRISLYLLLLLAVPIIFNADFILDIWLVDVPEYASSFLIAILLCSIVEAYGAPLWMSMQAIGQIKIYQIVVSSINALILPVAYLLLLFGISPVWIFVAKVFIAIILYLYRVVYILPKVGGVPTTYFRENILRSLLIISSSFFIAWGVSSSLSEPWIKLIVTTLVSVIFTLFVIYIWGLTQSEKLFVTNKMKDIKHRCFPKTLE